MALIDHPAGGYQFLPLPPDPRITGGPPFASAVRAQPGYEIVRAVFQRPQEYHAGFAAAAAHLAALGRPQVALCAAEVRVPRPLTVDEFAEFNVGYRAVLGEWGVYVDGHTPIARSNVAPLANPTGEVLLYGFSYTVPAAAGPPSFFLSAAPEKPTVRPGETTPSALREKVASAMGTMQSGLDAVEQDWLGVTGLGLYADHDLFACLQPEIFAKMGPATIHGLHWYFGPPPIVGIEIEIDVRGVRQELRLY